MGSFLDLRGHIFNDGRGAANGGFGVRYIGNSQVWGINTYYTFDTQHAVAIINMGLELRV